VGDEHTVILSRKSGSNLAHCAYNDKAVAPITTVGTLTHGGCHTGFEAVHNRDKVAGRVFGYNELPVHREVNLCSAKKATCMGYYWIIFSITLIG
jgi:hypothetical protein